MINNRQAGRRNRGRNNNNGGRPNGGNNRGGGDNGNRIDNRSRGNAAQLLEKYKNMARDAQMAGDRVNMEYYLQFADHYFRVLADNRARQEESQQRFRRPDEAYEEEDFEGTDEIGDFHRFERAPREQARESQGREQFRDQGRDQSRDQVRDQARDQDRQQDRRPYEAAEGREGAETREPRAERHDRQPRRERSERPRRERNSFEPVPGDENSVMPAPAEAAPQPKPKPQPAPTPAPVEAEAAPVEAPRRRGRPRKTDKIEAAEESQGLDATLLPPSIARADNDSGEDAVEEAPRRRRGRPRSTPQAAE